ncbi:MAG TPA: Fur family transcriptional regulator [Acidimicrobiales bacterium]
MASHTFVPSAHVHAAVDLPSLDELLERVRASGGRITTARRAVLQALLDAGDEHLTAEEVADRVHRNTPEVHLSTVYRTLESLEGLGILRQARLGAGPVSYHLAADEHHHAVCTSCGKVIVLPASSVASITRRLAKDDGFVADPQHLTITGLCADCA